MQNYNKLDSMETEELIKLYQDATQDEKLKNYAINKIITENEPLIYSVIKRYYPQKIARIETEDLVQQGRFGLFIAVQNYDPTFSTKFSTYAYTRIREYISEWINKEMGKSGSTHYNTLYFHIKRAINFFESQTPPHTPTTQEICDWINNNKTPKKKVSMSSVFNALKMAPYLESVSFEAAYADNRNTEMEIDEISDCSEVQEMRDCLMKAIDNLPYEEKIIYKLCTGYPNGKPKSIDATSKYLKKIEYFNDKNFSPFKVGKIYKRAMALLSSDPNLIAYDRGKHEFEKIVDEGNISLIPIKQIDDETDLLLNIPNLDAFPDYNAIRF